MKRVFSISTFCLALLVTTNAIAARPMTVDDLYSFLRVSDPHISPTGKQVAYVVGTVDMAENKTTANIWVAPTAGGRPRQLTTSPKHDRHPRFSPDGGQVLFESDRSGENQLWVIDLDGGEARQLTEISTGASGGVWSPDGKHVAFVSAVFAENSDKPFAEADESNRKRLKEVEESPVKARVHSRLFFRHWDSWVEGKRQHLFVVPASGGEPRDVTPGDRDAYPTSATFSGGDDFAFSPDGSHLIYTATPDKDEAWSTNYTLNRVSIDGGRPECLTAENEAADGLPRFSPDGAWLAYRLQRKPGYEADRWELVVRPVTPDGSPRGPAQSLTGGLDQSVDEFVWTGNAELWFASEQQARRLVSSVSVAKGEASIVVLPSDWGSFGSLSASQDGATVCGLQTAISQPAEVVAWIRSPRGKPGEPRDVSQANAERLHELELRRPKSVTVSGAGGAPMQMWILTPPGFDPKKKWPLAFLVHGGPQGAWMDDWSYRWNPQLWTAQGYVVALPNPRGSTGFGQQYVDEISGDWGGKCYEDLMAGADFLERQPYIDVDRTAAAGGSFGGYMMNWFAGHTTRFKTLISHCGVFNFDSMYATTDELWFDEWEHGGPPWGDKRESYEKHSPHRFADKFETPMLIVHGDLDFRVPVSEGYQIFTTLQRRGIESKMIEFPDEGHWVTKPANARFWHEQVFAWLARFAPPGPK